MCQCWVGAKSALCLERTLLMEAQLCSQEGYLERRRHRGNPSSSQSLRVLRQRNGPVRLDNVQA